MKPSKNSRSVNSGVSLISAIFLLLVLGGLAAAIVNVSITQQSASALDVLSARAYQAARAGIEWGLYRQLRPTPAATCFSSTSFAMPSGSSLSGFSVTVTCTLTTGPGSLERRQIIATACNIPASSPPSCPNQSNNPDYVQRVIQVDF